jgi:hypothetical protein
MEGERERERSVWVVLEISFRYTREEKERRAASFSPFGFQRLWLGFVYILWKFPFFFLTLLNFLFFLSFIFKFFNEKNKFIFLKF